MAYERRLLGRQKVRYNDDNDDNPLVFQLQVDGAKVTPTSATITIYKPGSTTALVSAAAMTVSGTLMTYALDTSTSTSNYAVGEGFRAEISVLYSSKTYPGNVIVFDVVKFLFVPNVTQDQLIAIDDNVRGMQHDSDEDFSELIGAMRDVLQVKIETRVTDGRRMRQEYFIDTSQVAVAFRYLVLSQIYRNRNNETMADFYNREYTDILEAILSVTPMDKDQDGEESGVLGSVEDIRFET